MAELWVTFLDVGWGDSILLEVKEVKGPATTYHFGLIDSNDTTNWPTSRVFLKRHFERHVATAGSFARSYPFFDVVVASHAHADHIGGLQAVIRRFGTDRLYSPRFNAANSPAMANLLRWASTATRNHVRVANRHLYLDKTTTFSLGPVDASVLWPPPPSGTSNAPYDASNENNNSLVIVLRLDDVRIVLTGDCQAENWAKPSYGGPWPIPLPAKHLKLVQIPHHGAKNGLFDPAGTTPLFEQIADLASRDSTVDPLIAVSCHPEPHGHPHPDVVAELDSLPIKKPFASCISGTHWLRTDRSLHYTFWTDGNRVEVRARPPF